MGFFLFFSNYRGMHITKQKYNYIALIYKNKCENITKNMHIWWIIIGWRWGLQSYLLRSCWLEMQITILSPNHYINQWEVECGLEFVFYKSSFFLLKSTSLFSQSQSDFIGHLNCEFKGNRSWNVHLPSRIETTIRSGIEPTTTAFAEVI